MSSVQWLPWSAGAFARARAEGKPVLLSIAATWCDGCRTMDQTSYSDPATVAAIGDRFIAIRVDADRRPDIAERYSLGGVPTTAFLNHDGAIVGGGTFLPKDRMLDALRRVGAAFASGEIENAGRAVPESDARASAPTAPENEASLTQVVFESFDEEHGGFRSLPKFPLTVPLHLALDLCGENRREMMTDVLCRSLDAMGWGPLYDHVDGGFFRCAMALDWGTPQQAKLLDVNVALMTLYFRASEVLGMTRYRDRAADVLRWIQTWLSDPVDGGWGSSQQGDAAYYAATSRGDRSAPPVDRVQYATSNAAMVSASLRLARATDDAGLAGFAVTSLERVLLSCYRPGLGVAHYTDGHDQVRGLLDDQVAMAAACLEAHASTGDIAYEMMAEELMRYAERTMWDAADGGFFDRAHGQPDDLGLLHERTKPFETNCEAAVVLHALAAASGEHEYRELARRALASQARTARAQGPQAAHYLVALRAMNSSDTLRGLP